MQGAEPVNGLPTELWLRVNGIQAAYMIHYSGYEDRDHPYDPVNGPMDMKRFRQWIQQANDMGLTEKVHILAGITPLKSGGMARYMAKNVSGISIPDDIIQRIVQAKKPAEEGIQLCVEQIEELKEMKGVHGVHLMAIEWEHRVPEIADRAKLIPRPQVQGPLE